MPPKAAKAVAEFMQKMYTPCTPPSLLELADCSRMKGLTWAQKLAYLAYKLHDPKASEVCPVTHFFEHGNYIRTMFIPKGQLFIGRVHRYGHIVKLISGKAFLIEEAGKQLKEAPTEMLTKPGYQTVAYTLSDVVAQTVHPNPDELRDVQGLEDDIFESAESVMLRGKQVAEQLLLTESV